MSIAPLSAASALARVRHLLRSEIDTLFDGRPEVAAVLRAALMAAIVVLGGFFYRRLDVLNSAAIAALVLLVARPLALRDSSFQLTFLAIGCIAGLAAPWLERNVQPYARALRGWRDVTRDASHEPRAAQLRIDVRTAAGCPRDYPRGLQRLRIAHRWQRKTVPGSSLGLLACSLVIARFPFPPAWSAGKLELSVLDVGQGDSLLVVSPGGKTLLIDGGGAFGGFGGQTSRGIDPGEEAVSPYLCSRGFQKLDVVALTHAHQDHLGGLSSVLENFHVEQLWIGREVRSAALAKLEQLARDKNIPIEHETSANTFALDTVRGRIF